MQSMKLWNQNTLLRMNGVPEIKCSGGYSVVLGISTTVVRKDNVAIAYLDVGSPKFETFGAADENTLSSILEEAIARTRA